MTSLPETLPDGGEGPLVSVVIPTYEDSVYLRGALSSIANQTYTNLEVIVVDSNGEAKPIVENLGWVEYHYQEPKGPAAARNLGVKHAEGEYIAFLDADDKWLPEKLERQVEVLEETDVGMAYTDQYVEEMEII